MVIADQEPTHIDDQSVTCWICNLPGHISRNCPQKSMVTPETPVSTGVANRGSGRKKKEDLTLDESNVYRY